MHTPQVAAILGALASFLLEAALQISGYTNVPLAIFLAVVGVGCLGYLAWPYRRWLSLRRFAFRWPLERRKDWPFNAGLSDHVQHALTHIFFDPPNHIRVYLNFFNSNPEEIVVESVTGHLNWPDSPISWTDRDPLPRGKPFDEFGVALRQYLSDADMAKLMNHADTNKPYTVEFHLQIRAKSQLSGKTFDLKTWDGFGVAKPTDPMVTSRVKTMRANLSQKNG